MADEYQKNKRNKTGREPQCRLCNNARIRRHYERDPAAKIAKTRQYHVDHPEWSKERLRAWYERNREEVLARDKARRESGDEEFIDRKRAATRRAEQRRRAQKAQTAVERLTQRDYDEILTEWDGLCWICEQAPKDVQWDHYQPLSQGGPHIRANLRPVCGPCNVRKNGQWPFTEDDRHRIAHEVRALTCEGVI